MIATRPFAASLAALSLVLAAPALAQTTVTLQRGLLPPGSNYAGTSDTRLNSGSPTQAYGGENNITLQQEAAGSSLLVRFKIFAAEGGPVPDGAVITSATLSLYKFGGPSAEVKASRLLRDWVEAEATWNVPSSTGTWGSAGANTAGSDYLATADGQTTAGDAVTDGCGVSSPPFPEACWLHLNVTSGVQAFAAGTPNYGWKLAQVGGTNSGKGFTAQNKTSPSVQRPKLTLTYTDEFASSEPPAPNGLAVPTFHSMSLYMDLAAAPEGNRVFVRYRRATDDPANPALWKNGYPLLYDIRTATTQCSSNCGLPYTDPVKGMQRVRGSVVHLAPGIKYVFELGTGADAASVDWQWHMVGTTWAQTAAKQWPETLQQDGATEPIPSGSGPFVIVTGGSPATGYKVYDGANGGAKNVIDRGGAGTGATGAETDDLSHAIVVRASYVVVRNVRATGAAIAGIYIAPGMTNVVVEDSVVDGWAHRHGVLADEPDNPNSWTAAPPSEEYWGWEHAAGVQLGGNNSRVVVQRNIITAPRNGSFPWDTGTGCSRNPVVNPSNHPHGPNGINIWTGGRQNVIRYNEITGDPNDRKKWFLDGIGGGENFSTDGSPGADSDIYQNIVMNVFDDAIEAEGGGRNVRIWGNYITHVKTAVATSLVHFGPTYVWRNVVNRTRNCYEAVTDEDLDWFSAAFKVSGRKSRDGISYGDGTRFLFNNTLLQDDSENQDFSRGPGRGVQADGGGLETARYTFARNNILHVRFTGNTVGQGWSVEAKTDGGLPPATADFAHNVYNGRYDLPISTLPDPFKFVDGQLTYKPAHGALSVPSLGGGGTGRYHLGDTSFGRNMGTHLSNFTRDVDDLASAQAAGYEAVSGTCNAPSDAGCPDPGAHQRTTSESSMMKFGISAGQ